MSTREISLADVTWELVDEVVIKYAGIATQNSVIGYCLTKVLRDDVEMSEAMRNQQTIRAEQLTIYQNGGEGDAHFESTTVIRKKATRNNGGSKPSTKRGEIANVRKK